MPKSDRRVRKTRQSLREALLQLLLEKPYDQITVQEILDKADVGRSTFYAHFKDKDDLLMMGMPEQVLDFTNVKADALIPSVTSLFEHSQEGVVWWKKLYGTPLMIMFGQLSRQKMVEDWTARIEALKSDGITYCVPSEIVATHLTGSLMSLLQWWQQNNMPYSPEEMNEMFHQMALNGLKEMQKGDK